MTNYYARIADALDRIATALEAQAKASDFLNAALLPEQPEAPYGTLEADSLDWRLGHDGKTLMIHESDMPPNELRLATPDEAEAIRARIKPSERRR